MIATPLLGMAYVSAFGESVLIHIYGKLRTDLIRFDHPDMIGDSRFVVVAHL